MAEGGEKRDEKKYAKNLEDDFKILWGRREI